ncbi:polymorphic toxin type 30 domain-containing protein [Streptomyces exfoliatus]|uniref:polymorphic toxin type 30 domain-containing protein n=1 Tax=Streptomyces exfoliatus TaxID=1905 RepID=UPI003C2C7631
MSGNEPDLAAPAAALAEIAKGIDLAHAELKELGMIGEASAGRGIIPKDAVQEPWKAIPGGVEHGIKWKWTDDVTGKTVRMRVHGPDLGPHAGPNASSGPIYRIHSVARPSADTVPTLSRKTGHMEGKYYLEFLRDLLSSDETVRTEASDRVQDFVHLLSGTQARVTGDLIAMLTPHEESRVALEALLHALSDLDGCGKLEGVDLSPLGDITESAIYVEHRDYLEEFAPHVIGQRSNTAE